MTRKIEVTIITAQKLIKLAVDNEKYELVEELSRAIIHGAPTNVTALAPAKKTKTSKKRGRKPKATVMTHEGVMVVQPDGSLLFPTPKSPEEIAKEKKRDYMRKLRAKKEKKND